MIGVDEAGRGALAGPVVAAAVGVVPAFYEGVWCRERGLRFRDSKTIGETEREELGAVLREAAADRLLWLGIGVGAVEEIGRCNILGATRLAMQRALEALAEQAGGDVRLCRDDADTAGVAGAVKVPARIWVDGRPLRPFPYRHEAIVRGDAKSLLIAMASVAAKTARDRTMRELGGRFSGYGFDQHKGYAVQRHFEALNANGPCEVHRTRFLRKWKACRNSPQ